MFKSEIQRLKGAQVQQEFLLNIYEGLNLEETCAAMRTNPAVLAFVRRDDHDFDTAIRQAQAYRVDLLVDKLEEIDTYQPDAKMAKVVSDNIRWLAERRQRDIYGAKLEVNHNHTISLADAIKEARERSLEIIDAKPLISIDSSTDNISVAQEIEEVEPQKLAEIDPLS